MKIGNERWRTKSPQPTSYGRGVFSEIQSVNTAIAGGWVQTFGGIGIFRISASTTNKTKLMKKTSVLLLTLGLASTAFGAVEPPNSLPFLGSLPIMGRLFTMPQTSHNPAPKPTEATRSLPVLGKLPIMGRLFQTISEATPKTK